MQDMVVLFNLKEYNVTQHKWHKEIKAWADGAEIEYRAIKDPDIVFQQPIWELLPDINPNWNLESIEYRIKPQPKEPQYLYVYEDSFYSVDEKDTRAGTRIMNKPIKEWKDNYLGKIKMEIDDA